MRINGLLLPLLVTVAEGPFICPLTLQGLARPSISFCSSPFYIRVATFTAVLAGILHGKRFLTLGQNPCPRPSCRVQITQNRRLGNLASYTIFVVQGCPAGTTKKGLYIMLTRSSVILLCNNSFGAKKRHKYGPA